MQQERISLVTIVAEAVLFEELVSAVCRLGATGYTAADVRGEGSRGLRVGDVPGNNVRIETLVGSETAARILDELAERFFPDYAIVAWVSEVVVARAGKYTRT